MSDYLNDVITSMRQALSLINNRAYLIPVVCVLSYSENDFNALLSSGRINNNFTMQDLAVEYFQGIIDDVTMALGADDIKNFTFRISGRIDKDAQSSTVIIFVDIYTTAEVQKRDMMKRAAAEVYQHNRNKYVEDIINRNNKKFLTK